MSRDIVIVPTYNRPEYLALCLEKLLEAGASSKEIWVVQDEHSDVSLDPDIFKQTTTVFLEANYKYPDCLTWIHRKPITTYGNSFNVLKSFREAYATSARHVYLVEDDVLVMPDFFRWHEAVQEKFRPFVSCAGRINRSLNFERNGREAIDESCRDILACAASRRAYGSWAACFSNSSLKKILMNAMAVDFCGPFFCAARAGYEQDIVIQEMMTRVGTLPSIWPYVPRAYHMGMSSYHRNAGLKFNGKLEEKIAALRATISDPYKIRLMALLQDDIDVYPTQPIPEWSGPLFLKSDYR